MDNKHNNKKERLKPTINIKEPTYLSEVSPQTAHKFPKRLWSAKDRRLFYDKIHNGLSNTLKRLTNHAYQGTDIKSNMLYIHTFY